MNRASFPLSISRLLAVLVSAVLLGMAMTDTAQAQRRPGGVGIGAQIGEPSGLSVMVYNPLRMSYDFLAAWDLDDFFFLNVHGIHEHHIDNTQNVHFFYGPGAFIGVRDRPRHRDDEVEAGLSATCGLGILIERIGRYARITPRLTLIPGRTAISEADQESDSTSEATTRPALVSDDCGSPRSLLAGECLHSG